MSGRHKGLLALAVLTPFIGLTGIATVSAAAATRATIEQTSIVPLDTMFLDIAVDPTTDDVFVSTADQMMKLSEDGTELGTVALDYPLGEVFAGGSLWMSLVDSNEVVAMNPITL